MSYEFHLANPDHAKKVDPDEPFSDGPIDPVAEQRKRDLADALIALNPQLEKFSLNYDAIAQMEGLTVEQAKQRWRHVELNGPEDGNGIQITLWDTHATISVPFWHSGEEAVAVMEEIWEYMKLCNSVAGMRAFDPQLGCELDLGAGFKSVLGRFARGVSMLDSEVEAEDE